MTKNEDKKYKVFISYSWSPPAHKDWVRGLADDLMDNGVETMLDQWDIRPGDDISTYMESMVLDETIDKVIMVCNASYAQKANSRKKGVGIEAQIISKAIYQDKKQDKFISVVSEMDDKGEPYLPVYCKGRFFIDMSNEDRRLEGFDELLREIYNEPLHPKPKIGRKRNFPSNKGVGISISSIAQQASYNLRKRNNNATDVTEDCLSACVEVMEKLSIEENSPRTEVIVNRVNEFLPIRNDVVKVFYNMARYLPEGDAGNLLHVFFQKILIYYFSDKNVQGSGASYKADHFKFLTHEMFLYAIAALIKREKFEDATTLLDNEYYVSNPSHPQTVLSFAEIMVLLEVKCWSINQNKSPNQGNMSSRSNTLIERATILDLPLIDIQQADLVLAIKSAGFPDEGRPHNNFWLPIVAPYVKSSHVFEIFSRAQNKKYFDKIKNLLGAYQPCEISRATEDLCKYMRDKEWEHPNIFSTAGIDKLYTRE